MSGTYTDLEVWRSAMDLVEDIYRITKTFPKEETYTLTSQLRRAAISVPSNIAEGKGRSSDKELAQFLCHSRGSLFEIETLRKTAPVGQLLNGLLRAFRTARAA